MSLRRNPGEILMAMAELIRQDETLDLGDRQALRRVTGWWDSSYERYPGTSSTWTEHQVTVGYETWGGEYKVHDIRGEVNQLMERLADIVSAYGSER